MMLLRNCFLTILLLMNVVLLGAQAPVDAQENGIVPIERVSMNSILNKCYIYEQQHADQKKKKKIITAGIIGAGVAGAVGYGIYRYCKKDEAPQASASTVEETGEEKTKKYPSEMGFWETVKHALAVAVALELVDKIVVDKAFPSIYRFFFVNKPGAAMGRACANNLAFACSRVSESVKMLVEHAKNLASVSIACNGLRYSLEFLVPSFEKFFAVVLCEVHEKYGVDSEQAVYWKSVAQQSCDQINELLGAAEIVLSGSPTTQDYIALVSATGETYNLVKGCCDDYLEAYK